MLTNIRYVLITAIRDRLFVGLFLGVIGAALVSSFMGGTAMIEPEQMTLAFSAAAARFILVIGLIVFTCFHLRSAFDTKEVDVLLSRPISRVNLVISYWLGFAVVATVLVMATLAVILVVGILDVNGFIIWSLSLLAEAWLVVAMSLFAAFTLRSAVGSVLATLGFYVLSRMMGFFIATSHSSLLFSDKTLDEGLRMAIELLAIVVPRMDLFTESNWLLYGIKQSHDAYLFAVQAGIFIPLLLTAAIIDFKRKQF